MREIILKNDNRVDIRKIFIEYLKENKISEYYEKKIKFTDKKVNEKASVAVKEVEATYTPIYMVDGKEKTGKTKKFMVKDTLGTIPTFTIDAKPKAKDTKKYVKILMVE